MRRSLPLALALTATALAGCGSNDPASVGVAESAERLDVTVGFYPYEFVVERVGGDDVSVTNLTEPGAEPHDLELSPQQVAELSETDLVVYSKGFQPAVDEAVEQQAEDRSFDVLEQVELIEGAEHAEVGHSEEEGAHAEGEEPPSGEEGTHSEEPHAGESEEEHAAHEGEGDPHVWLDPTRLATIAGAVAKELGERAPEQAAEFEQRAQALQGELKELDTEMREGLTGCPRNEIVTSHDAFGYLAAAYGLEQVPLAGLSPEDEASPKRLAEVATFAKEQGVTTIFFEELVSPKVAESLAREVGAEAKVLSPLEGPPESGDYLSAMRTNLQSLRTALGCA